MKFKNRLGAIHIRGFSPKNEQIWRRGWDCRGGATDFGGFSVFTLYFNHFCSRVYEWVENDFENGEKVMGARAEMSSLSLLNSFSNSLWIDTLKDDRVRVAVPEQSFSKWLSEKLNVLCFDWKVLIGKWSILGNLSQYRCPLPHVSKCSSDNIWLITF